MFKIAKIASDNGSALSKKFGAGEAHRTKRLVRGAPRQDDSPFKVGDKVLAYELGIGIIKKIEGRKYYIVWKQANASGWVGKSDIKRIHSSANRAPSVVAPSSRALKAAAPTAANTAEEVARAELHDTVQKIIDIIPASAFLTEEEGNKIVKEIEDIVIAIYAKKDCKFCSKKSILDQLETAKSELSEIIKDYRNADISFVALETEEVNKLERIEITLEHAAKWIKLNSFSELNHKNPHCSKQESRECEKTLSRRRRGEGDS